MAMTARCPTKVAERDESTISGWAHPPCDREATITGYCAEHGPQDTFGLTQDEEADREYNDQGFHDGMGNVR